MGGAKRIANLTANLLKLTSNPCLPIYVWRIVSFIVTLVGERGPDYQGVHIAYSDLTIITKDNNSDRPGLCWEQLVSP